MNAIKKLALFLAFPLLFSCDQIQPSQAEIAAGLKSALEVGSKYALRTLGVENGFLLDEVVKIGLPEDAANFVMQVYKNPILSSVLGTTIKRLEEQLVLTLNRAAEASIEGVIPIVIDAITSMTIQDAQSILFSSNQIAATDYLQVKTYNSLSDVCRSVIEDALNKKIVLNTSAQDVWRELTGVYNQAAGLVPGLLKPIETNLSLYTTQKTLDAVFLKIGNEEVKIRTDVSARTNDLLRRVFGMLD
ncbi:MAG: DUF4197 domain-containing protein [Bacteroidetes bacterium]|nr:DUF4197 domain-containing protein [Bacteroidota bacterium]MCL2301742.1 DUF4197 domain-containing protein [Lentimicrobiaceae bacterium]